MKTISCLVFTKILYCGSYNILVKNKSVFLIKKHPISVFHLCGGVNQTFHTGFCPFRTAEIVEIITVVYVFFKKGRAKPLIFQISESIHENSNSSMCLLFTE